VVTVHGAGDDRRWFVRHLPIFHEAGYPVLLFDCREHGVSDGVGRGISFGIREHRDVSSAVAYLRRERGLVRVAVIGTSQGGASVIMAAASDPQIDAVIAENPFTSVADLLRDTHGEDGSPPRPLAGLIAFFVAWRAGGLGLPSPLEAVPRIAPRPLFLLHGTADRKIPFSHSERLREAAGQPVELWLAPGADHALRFDRYPDEYRARVGAFLARWLGDARAADPVGDCRKPPCQRIKPLIQTKGRKVRSTRPSPPRGGWTPSNGGDGMQARAGRCRTATRWTAPGRTARS